MDAARARRRELRKRKILQNAEDRIKKLTGSVVANVEEHLEKQTDFGNDSALKLHARQNVNNCSTKVDLNCETTTPREKLLHGNYFVHQDEPTEMRDKTDGYVRKERVNKNNEQQTDESFHDQTTTHSHKEKILNENFPKHQDEPTEMQDKTDGYVRKERLHEIDQQQVDENGTESNTEPEAVDSKISNVRPVIVMILAMLCFTKSLYLPAISLLLGSPWFLEIYNEKEFSFIIPFCILEIVLFFTPSIRKVTPGKQVNIWLLALKLCGVSPEIVDAAKIVILEILEFLTDFAMFIFVLVILQNVKELYVQNNFIVK